MFITKTKSVTFYTNSLSALLHALLIYSNVRQFTLQSHQKILT